MSPFLRAGVLLVLALLLMGQSKAHQLSEDQAVEKFMAESPRARALRARVDAVRAEARSATLMPNPDVFISREDAGGTRDEFLSVQQALPVSGRLGLLRRAGSAAIGAAQAALQFELLRLRCSVRLAFQQLVSGEAREAVMRGAVADMQELASILREREREGEASGYDLLRAERELADLQAELGSATVEVAQAKARLAALFAPGTDSASLASAPSAQSVHPLPPVSELLQRALMARSDLQNLKQRFERFDLERQAAQRLAIPEPVLTAGLKRAAFAGTSGTGYVASLTIPLPVFNRGQADVARAQALQEQSRSEAEALQQQIEAEVRAAYQTVLIQRKLAVEYQRQAGSKGAELKRIAELSYQEGERGILELLDANRVARMSQLRALELRLAVAIAEIALEQAVGEEVLR